MLQAVARRYYRAPQGALGAEVRSTVAWDRLKEAWFQEKTVQGDVWEDERAFAVEVRRERSPHNHITPIEKFEGNNFVGHRSVDRLSSRGYC